MNSRDFWLLGLFAMAFLYLDSTSAPAPRGHARLEQPLAPEEDLPVFPVASRGVVPRNACPRNLAHRVSLRGDGAMWCLACDEGFFPERTIWGTVTGGSTLPALI